MDFYHRRNEIKQNLYKGLDKSPKGALDDKVVELCDHINRSTVYYTTSSCSGRISIFIQYKSTNIRNSFNM